MPNEDTIKLLRECNSGVKMAVESLDEVIPKVENHNLRHLLEKYLQEHKKLGDQTHTLLTQFHDEGKDPNPVAVAMSWFTTHVKLSMGEVDQKIADLMTDGCNMGIKSISRYLNQYPTALLEVQSLAKDIIKVEENFMHDLRKYL